MEQNHFSIKLLLYCIPVLSFAGCKVPYDPPVNSSKTHYLVVDGYLDGNGTTTIKLSRTRNISTRDTAADIMEKGAHLVIEDENNDTWPPLDEIGNGIYAGVFSLFPANRYRLHITTADGREYLSDFVSYKLAPPIDNITWDFKGGDVQLYANTHDPQNNTTFYRWSYEETWEFHSFYVSNLKFDPQTQALTPRTDQVHICWQSQNSFSIFIGSSAKLNEDVINKAPLNLISYGDKRISVLYSTLVTQYALDSAGYNYWNAMKGNTENVGSIFDPQPNLTRGNIHCTTDPSELVIGYIGAGTTQQQRIFIDNNQMPPGWNSIPDCPIDSIDRDSIVYFLGDMVRIPIDKVTDPFSRFACTASSRSCTDCTFFGTNIKPLFWP
jgi:hypothetical protein